jgi:hypothetical protein
MRLNYSSTIEWGTTAGLPKMLHTNFYEKALFVKTDVAVALCGRVQLLCALRALCFYPHFR